MEPPSLINVNGTVVDWERGRCHLWTDTAQRGLNVFDAIRGYAQPREGCVRLLGLDLHLQRLIRSAHALSLPVPVDLVGLRKAIGSLLVALKLPGHVYVRPTIFVERGGYEADVGKIQVGYYVVIVPVGSFEGNVPLITAACSRWTKIENRSFPSQIKCGAAYSLTRLARIDALNQGANEALLFNASGNLCETPGANIFMVKGRVVTTPPVEDGILAGITRGFLSSILRDDMGIEVREVSVPRGELISSDEVFICGTLAEVTAIRSIDSVQIGNGGVGPITKEVAARYAKLCSGKNKDHNNSFSVFCMKKQEYLDQ